MGRFITWVLMSKATRNQCPRRSFRLSVSRAVKTLDPIPTRPQPPALVSPPQTRPSLLASHFRSRRGPAAAPPLAPHPVARPPYPLLACGGGSSRSSPFSRSKRSAPGSGGEVVARVRAAASGHGRSARLVTLALTQAAPTGRRPGLRGRGCKENRGPKGGGRGRSV